MKHLFSVLIGVWVSVMSFSHSVEAKPALGSCGYGAVAASVAFKGSAWEYIPFSTLKKFSHLWAFSDTHGHLKELKLLLLQANLIVKIEDDSKKDGSRLAWNPQRNSDLVIVVGDLIDDGDDSVGVVMFLDRLKKEAAQVGSRVILTLGNHEARFLANGPKGEAEKDLLDSAELKLEDLRKWDTGSACDKFKGAIRGAGVRAEELVASHFGCYLKNLPIGVVAGSWLFAHSGFFAVEEAGRLQPKLTNPAAYIQKVSQLHRVQDYSILGSDENPLSAPITRHDWWKESLELNFSQLQCLGVTHLSMGHQSAALFVKNEEEIAVSADGRMVKLDSGLKKYDYTKKDDYHKGRIMKCDLGQILRAKGAQTSVQLLDPKGRALCRQIGAHAGKGVETTSNIKVDLDGEPLTVAPTY